MTEIKVTRIDPQPVPPPEPRFAFELSRKEAVSLLLILFRNAYDNHLGQGIGPLSAALRESLGIEWVGRQDTVNL